MFDIRFFAGPSSLDSENELPGGWISITYGFTEITVEDQSVRLWNHAGTNYLAFSRAIQAILEPVPDDMRRHLAASRMYEQHSSIDHLERELKRRDPVKGEDAFGEALGALWSWQRNRMVTFDRVRDEPDLWFWVNEKLLQVELIHPRLLESSSRSAGKCSSGVIPVEEFLGVVERYRSEIHACAQQRLERIPVSESRRQKWANENLVFLATPFSEFIEQGQKHETDWDEARAWYKRLELARAGVGLL